MPVDFSKNIDEIAKEARKEAGGIDDTLAQELMAKKLSVSAGFFQWTSMGDWWLFRTPRTDKETEEWLRAEPPESVHICHPAKFLAAVEQMANKEEASKHVGYAKENMGNVVECHQCGNHPSEDTTKRLLLQRRMLKIGKAAS